MGIIVWTTIAVVLIAWVWELLSWQPGQGGEISELFRDYTNKRESKRLEKLKKEYDDYVIQEKLVTTRYNKEIERLREHQVIHLHNLNAYERLLAHDVHNHMDTLEVHSYELESKDGYNYEYIHYTPVFQRKKAN